jgi:hypothetical protein
MNVKLGLEIVNHAVKHDNEERIQEATYLYDIAIEFFKKALQGIFGKSKSCKKKNCSFSSALLLHFMPELFFYYFFTFV